MRGERPQAHHHQQAAHRAPQRQALRGLGVHHRQGVHGLHQPRAQELHADVLPRLQLHRLQGHLLTTLQPCWFDNLIFKLMKKGGEGMMLTEIGVEERESTPVLDVNLKHELLKELQPQILARIKKGFELYKGAVNMNQFIVIMIDVLFQQTQWKKYAREILTFIELFLLIDLNHLQRIRFEDFTNYLIDREEGSVYKEEFQFVPATRLNELDVQAEKIFKLEGSPNMGILTNGKRNVEILDKKSYKRVDHLTCGGPLINNIIYIERSRVYCLVSNDKHISFYENMDHTLIRRFSLPDNIYFLQLFGEGSASERLICASTNGHIYELSLARILSVLDKKNKEALKEEERKIREYKPQNQYKYFMLNRMLQAQPDITCIDIMETLEILVTGANDSRVRLYQMRENGLHLSKQLDGHYKGIKGVAVSVHHKLIVSCSFDFDILVWNAYLQHPVARLQGHQAPLMNVQCPKKYQIIISMDAKSVMKIWSSENYQLLQNIVIYENFPANTTINIVYKNENNLAMIWTKKVKFFEYVVNYNPKLTDDQDITAIKYSSKNLEVYIGSKKSLKVWSITKGIQIKNYKNIVKGDISIIELDDRERRCFAGTIEGEIISIDLFSGLIINVYSSHSHQISLLLYNNAHKLLISGGWDRKLKIHNDTHHLERIEARENVMRIINNVSDKELNGGSFSLTQLCIATHCKTNVCKLWDFEKGFLETQYIVPNEISTVLFIDPLPILVIVDIKGTIYFFSTKYLPKNPYKLLTQWKNMYSIQKSSQITFISSNYVVQGENEIKCELILGDEFGYIRIVDISAFIKDKDIKPVTPQMIGNKNPYRIEDYNYLGTTQNSANTHDFSHHQSNNIVPPGNIRQKLQIRGHSDRVTYVALVNESSERLILSAGSDNLVKIWNEKGEPRGTMRQGLTENRGWSYEVHKEWSNKETNEYLNIKKTLSDTFDDYLHRKRIQVVPFTDDNIYEEINNNEIYKDLREVEGYLQKTAKKTSHRLY